jgi:hypothetical protein
MKISTLAAVFVFLIAPFPLTPASAQVAGTAAGNIGGGSPITPLHFSPQNITRPDITRPNITRPNITRAPARHSDNATVEHFQEGIVAAQQSQQKAWEAEMKNRQMQWDQAQRAAADAAEAAKAAKIAPAAGDSAIKSEPYQPSIFIVGFAKFANMLARLHNHKAADAP